MQEFISKHQLLIHRCYLGSPWLVGDQCWGVPSIDHFKRRALEGRVIRGIVAKFSPRKPLKPRPGTIPYEAVELHCDHLTTLRLPIGRRVEGRAHLQFDTRQFEQFKPKGTSKHCAPITYNRTRNPMKPDNGLKESFCYQCSAVRVTEHNKMRKLGESVRHR
jgi:hypothetical protein